jgi:hypothetical protein
MYLIRPPFVLATSSIIQLKPEFLKPENQQMVDVLAAYRQPLANLRRELSKMRTSESQPIEDKSVIFATVP